MSAFNNYSTKDIYLTSDELSKYMTKLYLILSHKSPIFLGRLLATWVFLKEKILFLAIPLKYQKIFSLEIKLLRNTAESMIFKKKFSWSIRKLWEITLVPAVAAR